MGRIAGTPNKITAEVRGKLENLIDSLVDSIEIDDLNTSQRIKMLQIALQYNLQKFQAMVIKDLGQNLPVLKGLKRKVIKTWIFFCTLIWMNTDHLIEQINFTL